jgi:hypothetical protein
VAAQIGLNGALQSLNVISVVQSAQVMDVALSALLGRSCGLNLTPFRNTIDGSPIAGSDHVFSCIDAANLAGGNGWGCHVVISLGYVIVAAMAIPCGRWNLDDNMIIQRGAFVLTVGCWLVWLVAALTALASDDDLGAGNGTRHGGGNGTAHAAFSLPAINLDARLGTQAGVLGRKPERPTRELLCYEPRARPRRTRRRHPTYADALPRSLWLWVWLCVWLWLWL